MTMDYDGRRYRPRCEACGVFLSYDADGYTPYGCSSYSPPEPHDPRYLCKKHSDELHQRYLEAFKRGSRSGDWCKSNAERRAAEECGLVWSNGVGVLGTKEWADAQQYISREEYERLKALPYWGWCKLCGAENKNGYCGDSSCSLSFKSKFPANEVQA